MIIRQISKFNVILFWVALLVLNGVTSSQIMKTSDKNQQIQVAEKADFFVNHYHKTLNIENVFKKVISQKATENIREGRMILGEIDKDFFRKQDRSKKERLFFAEMNFIFIQATYSLVFMKHFEDEKKQDLSPPAGFKKAVKKFRFVKTVFDENNSYTMPLIDTNNDFLEYLNELEKVNEILRKLIPQNYPKLSIYKKNYAKFLADSGDSFKPQIKVSKGNSYFNIKDETDVFFVARDVFKIYFIEEDEQMKLLGFGIGN